MTVAFPTPSPRHGGTHGTLRLPLWFAMSPGLLLLSWPRSSPRNRLRCRHHRGIVAAIVVPVVVLAVAGVVAAALITATVAAAVVAAAVKVIAAVTAASALAALDVALQRCHAAFDVGTAALVVLRRCCARDSSSCRGCLGACCAACICISSVSYICYHHSTTFKFEYEFLLFCMLSTHLCAALRLFYVLFVCSLC